MTFGALLLLIAAPLLPQTFATGDVVLSGNSPAPFSTWKVIWLDGNGNFKGTLYDQPLTPFAGADAMFGPRGLLHAIVGGAVRRIGADGSVFTVSSPGFSPSFLTFGADGRLYLAGRRPSDIRELWELDSSLAVTRTFPIAMSAVDLAADQCTLYYSAGPAPGHIGRFDVCRGLALSPFTQPEPGMVYGMIRIIPGGVLHSRTGPGGVVRRNEHGQIVQTYPGWGFALALDPDGRSFWTVAGPPRSLYKVDIATGNVVGGPIPIESHLGSVFSIAVAGEPRAALAAVNAGDVPSLSTWALIVVGVGLAFIALSRLR